MLRSDRVLLNMLSKKEGIVSANIINTDITADYEHYNFRYEELKHAFHAWGVATGSITETIRKLSKQYLVYSGKNIHVRHNKSTQYQELVAYVDPVLLQASLLSENLNSGYMAIYQIDSLLNNQHPLAYPVEQFHGVEYSDNHIHTGGILEAEAALVQFQFEALKANKNRFKDLDSIPREFSFLRSEQLKSQNLPNMLNALSTLLIDFIQKKPDKPRWQELSDLSNPILANTQGIKTNICLPSFPPSAVEELLHKAYLMYGQAEYNKSHLLILTAIIYFIDNFPKDREAGKQWFLRTFHAYLCCSHVLRSLMVMRGVGLTDFIGFFRSSFRQNTVTNNLQSVFNRRGRADYEALKQGPLTVSKLNKTFQDAIRFTEVETLSQNHFCLHFSRSCPDGDGKKVLKKRQAVNKEIEKLAKLWSPAAIRKKKKNHQSLSEPTDYDLAQWIRGLDVAGNENHYKIEVFAPALRWLRGEGWQKTPFIWPKLRTPYLSVHAGEDFNHILSGLRHIDETVRYCDYQANDRLGHALALGISPKQWAQRQSSFYLTRGEYLDNLVWCHHYATELSAIHPTANAMTQWLDSRIQKEAAYLYANASIETNGFTPLSSHLFQAWQLRRNCPLKYKNYFPDDKQHSAPVTQRDSAWLPDFSAKNSGVDRMSEHAYGLWQHYASPDPLDDKQSRFDELLLFVYDNSDRYATDSDVIVITDKELELYELIQDYLITQYDHMGIILEACPTSNVYIARLEDYHEHPVFRWYPPKSDMLTEGSPFNKFGLRKGPVRVCINTDDPGIFPTDLPNEHRSLKEAAIQYHGVCHEDAHRWSERLREIGVETFNQQRCSLVYGE